MRTYRRSGPFREQPYFKLEEIERMCTEELRAVSLFPSSPGPVRIERFIEKRFRVAVTYEDLPQGVLGFTRFGSSGVETIVVSRALSEDGTLVSERRLNTTLAHEAGHGLLHAHLFALGPVPPSVFGNDDEERVATRILCREEAVLLPDSPTHKAYGGRWWEFQANRAIGGLLLPRRLVEESLAALLTQRGNLGLPSLEDSSREEAIRVLVDVFHVNPVVGRIRLDELYPALMDRQLTL